MDKVSELYDRIVDKDLTVRRIYVVANHVKDESKVKSEPEQIQLTLFDDPEEIERKHAAEKAERERERKIQETSIKLKKKFGKNAILKGTSLEERSTAKMRNKLIGGHNGGEDE